MSVRDKAVNVSDNDDRRSTVRLERAGALVRLVLDRPEALNAISTAHARAIAAACATIADDARISAVVVTSSSPKAFCVGADLKERRGMTTEQMYLQRPVLSAAFGGVLGLPVPTIAAVDGHALGGGFELALSCDLIVASEAASFALPEVGLGLVPGGGGTQLLTRRVGSNTAADLVFSTRRIDGTEAHRLRIVDRLTGPGGAAAAAEELATRIAQQSPVALRQAKIALRHGLDLSLPDGLDVEERAWREAVASPDRLEGIAAFNEKRPPRWPGRIPG